MSNQYKAQQEPAAATKTRASPRKVALRKPATEKSAKGKRKHADGLDDNDDDDDDFKVVHYPWSAFPCQLIG